MEDGIGFSFLCVSRAVTYSPTKFRILLFVALAMVVVTRVRGLGAAPMVSSCYDVALQGNRLYVANGEDGVAVFDVGRPEQPRLVNRAKIAGSARALASLGNHVFVAGGKHVLTVVDFASERPHIIVAGAEAFSSDVTLFQNKAYVTVPERGICVFDISKPARPAALEEFRIDGSPVSFVISGMVGILCDTRGDIRFLDLSAPRLSQLSKISSRSIPFAAAVFERTAYVADFSKGIMLCDFSDPLRPRFLGKPRGPGGAVAISLQRYTLVVARKGDGVSIYRIGGKHQLKAVGHFKTAGTPMGIARNSTHIFVACGGGGVAVIRLSEGGRPMLIKKIPPEAGRTP